MRGEPFEALKNGVRIMIDSLSQNPQALETTFLSITTIGENERQLMPLKELVDFKMPFLKESNFRYLGNALGLLTYSIDNEIVKSTKQTKGDWIPLVLIFLSGEPDDEWLLPVIEYHKRKHTTVLCRAGMGISDKTSYTITNNVVDLDTATANSVSKFFNWISDTRLSTKAEIDEDEFDLLQMRRLPVYFLLDTSGSMYGEPIQALNNALSSMLNNLRSDPQALDSLWISIITFNREVEQLTPLTELASFQLPEITCPQSGPTHTGKALEVLQQIVTKEVVRGSATQKGDWRPLLFLFTDGKPSDLQLYREMIPKIKALNFSAVVACAAGQLANDDLLKELTDTVVHLDTTDSSTLKMFFKWVSDTIEQGSNSIGTRHDMTLPPPPSEINLVI